MGNLDKDKIDLRVDTLVRDYLDIFDTKTRTEKERALRLMCINMFYYGLGRTKAELAMKKARSIIKHAIDEFNSMFKDKV